MMNTIRHLRRFAAPLLTPLLLTAIVTAAQAEDEHRVVMQADIANELAQDSGPRGTVTNHGAQPSRSPLVDKVRRATERFRDINVAISEGWVQATPCVSGPNSGAMGVHYVQPSRLGDGVLNADEPEALIYEPRSDGRWRLVGVEFIEIAEVWDTQNGGQPVLDGHLLNLVGAPNRYTLPAFYELHVWAWEGNPNGSFADWNTRVSCDKQPGPGD